MKKLKEVYNCAKNLYLAAENKGNIKSDSEITEEAVVYAATECIDPVTLEKLKSFWSMKNLE